MFGDVPARWLPNGETALRRVIAVIDAAAESIRLEMYIYSADGPGDAVRLALVRAAGRGVKVRVLLDAWGSRELPGDFWKALREDGGVVREFNPLSLERLAIRDHRKLLVADDRVALIGGFNIAPEYAGDGVMRGWYDLGVELSGEVVAPLAATFEQMWAHHELRHPFEPRLRRRRVKFRAPAEASTQVLATGPGLGPNAFRRRLFADLHWARDVQIVSAYFTPSFGLRRALQRVVHRGGRVQLLLAGRSDVPLAQLAARSYYGRLMRAGVEIAEYQPQILHAKLALVDDAVFVGSSNLDARSLGINYEVMVRLHDPALAEAGRALFRDALSASRTLKREWTASRTWADRLYGRWASFLLTKVDPWIAQRQLRGLV